MLQVEGYRKKKNLYKVLWLQIPGTHFKLLEAKEIYCEQ